MTIELSKDLEKIVRDAVRAGLYAREDDVIRDALMRLKRAMPRAAKPPDPERAEPAPRKPPQTKDEFHRHLMEIGLMSQLPETETDFDDPEDEPIEIEGEPLSETVIRERR